MRSDENRLAVQRLLRQKPFQPFALVMENGDRIIIEHAENIAFVPTSEKSKGSMEFYVLSNQFHLFSTFEAVTGVTRLDRGEPPQNEAEQASKD